ncbi:MAG: CaiB/BaiF CoA-transferase family protein [Bacteroidota bacterium]
MDPIFKDLVVVELASVLAGPSVGMFFAELGARVIKVENPRLGGDVTRSWKLAHEDKEDSRSAYFSCINWGKESLTLDLKAPGDLRVLERLLGQADILLSSFIPGQAERLGIGPERLLKAFPRLICGEINGYGKENPRPAYDAIIQAEAGFMYINGEGENRYKMPVALMDVLAAHQLKEALLLALIQRGVTGKGKRVTVSLLQSGISALVNQATNWLVGGKVPQAMGSAHPNIAPYGSKFRCADGNLIVLAVGSDAQFATLCQILGVAVPANYVSNRARLAEREKLATWLSGLISQWESADLLAKFDEQSVPAGAINTMPQVMEQSLAEAILLQGPSFKGLRSIVSEHPHLPLSEPPKLGQHTDAILQEFGLEKK